MESKKIKDLIPNIKGHFMTITNHKILVTKTCFQVGLYKQGILHDLSKYHPLEFIAGVKYYQGTRSPIAREKELNGYSLGWLHHKGRNAHHFEYWIDYGISPGSHGKPACKDGKPKIRLQGMKMSKKYVAEMIIDRISASKNYLKEKYTDDAALVYYMNGRDMMLIHEESDYLARYLLTILAKHGEDYLLQYMKSRLLKHRNRDYHVRDGRLYLD